QLDERERRTLLREPAVINGLVPGVTVRGVSYDGQPYPPGAALTGLPIALSGRTSTFAGPVFTSRNNIVGSDDTMALTVDPFDLRIGNEIRALDFLDPADAVHFHQGNNHETAIGPSDHCFKTTEIWQIANPVVYQRRMPIAFNATSTE